MQTSFLLLQKIWLHGTSCLVLLPCSRSTWCRCQLKLTMVHIIPLTPWFTRSEVVHHGVILRMSPWPGPHRNKAMKSFLHGLPHITGISIKSYTLVTSISVPDHKHISPNDYRVHAPPEPDHVSISKMPTWSYHIMAGTINTPPNTAISLRKSSKNPLDKRLPSC